MKKYFGYLWNKLNDGYSLMMMGGAILGYTIAGSIRHRLSFDGYLLCIGMVFVTLFISITIAFIILKKKGI